MVLLDRSAKTVNVYEESRRFSSRPLPDPNAVCPMCRRSLFKNTQATPGSVHIEEYFLMLEEMHRDERITANSSTASHSDQVSEQAFNNGYYTRFFEENEKIGSGGYGSVFLCTHLLDNVNLGSYAVKKIPVGDNRSWLVRVLREVRAVESVRHPNVVAYKHSWLEFCQIADFGPEVPCLFVLMEFANLGNLKQHIDSLEKDSFLPENDIRRLFIDLCHGLRHLHHCGILHRDIKPENLLLHADIDTCTEQRHIRVVISDFGESESLKKASRGPRTGNTGTPLFCAPEMLLDNSDYDDRADVYSLGMVLVYMCYRGVPHDGDNLAPDSLYERKREDGTLKFPYFPHRSASLQNLILSLTQFNAELRPTMDAVMMHPFLRDYQSKPIIDNVIESVPNSSRQSHGNVLAISQAPSSRTQPLSLQTPLMHSCLLLARLALLHSVNAHPMVTTASVAVDTVSIVLAQRYQNSRWCDVTTGVISAGVLFGGLCTSDDAWPVSLSLMTSAITAFAHIFIMQTSRSNKRKHSK